MKSVTSKGSESVDQVREPPGPGQESVWDYPRPPRLERVHKHLQVIYRGKSIADTTRGFRVLETSHPPVYYFPPDDVRKEFIQSVRGKGSYCEWKGTAVYHDVVVEDQILPAVAWSYPSPTRDFEDLRDYLAFYAGPMDSCLVDGEEVVQQPGGIYGGWITRDVVGPFKGVPGSRFW